MEYNEKARELCPARAHGDQKWRDINTNCICEDIAAFGRNCAAEAYADAAKKARSCPGKMPSLLAVTFDLNSDAILRKP